MNNFTTSPKKELKKENFQGSSKSASKDPLDFNK
jgi:hypothetical protein